MHVFVCMSRHDTGLIGMTAKCYGAGDDNASPPPPSAGETLPERRSGAKSITITTTVSSTSNPCRPSNYKDCEWNQQVALAIHVIVRNTIIVNGTSQ
eukprot:1157750-Pelagomonas_calceolata.AAC.16